jgi:hypothetical protein
MKKRITLSLIAITTPFMLSAFTMAPETTLPTVTPTIDYDETETTSIKIIENATGNLWNHLHMNHHRWNKCNINKHGHMHGIMNQFKEMLKVAKNTEIEYKIIDVQENGLLKILNHRHRYKLRLGTDECNTENILNSTMMENETTVEVTVKAGETILIGIEPMDNQDVDLDITLEKEDSAEVATNFPLKIKDVEVAEDVTTVNTKEVNEEFKVKVVQENSDLKNVSFKSWLEDIDTNTELTEHKKYHVKNEREISFKIQNAYRNVHMMFEVCSDYDSATDTYKLYNYDTCRTTCQTADEEHCLRTIQSEEGFAVTPNRFETKIYKAGTSEEIKDTTYVAGENFDIEVKAVDKDGNTISNFNEEFTIVTTKSDEDMIENGVFTPSSEGQLKFENGILKFQGNYSEVGDVKIKVADDITFAQIDENDGGEEYKIPGAEFEAGEFIPYAFEVENISLRDIIGNNKIDRTNCIYNYLNETSKDLTKLKYGMTIHAINKNGEITKNYNGEYAKDTNIQFDINWKNISSNNVSDSTTLTGTIASGLWDEGIYTTAIGSEFAKDIDLLSKVGVSRNVPFEPFGVSLKDESNLYTNNVEVSDGEVQNTNDLGNRSFDITTDRPDTLYYVYGRVNPIDATSTPGGDATVSIYYEIYSNTNTGIINTVLGTTSLKESVNDSKWWRNTKHNACDKIFSNNLNIEFNNADTSITASDFTNTDKDVITVANTSSNRPLDVIGSIKFDTSNSFLFTDPYSTTKITKFNLKFVDGIADDNNKVDTAVSVGKHISQRRFR